MQKIVDWSEIEEEFRDALVLGNGASIAIHQGFEYQSLLQEARRRFLISKQVEDIFDHLCTRDFERVLLMLWHASRINKALRIKEKKTTQAYKSLRSALVKTVTKIHPAHSDVIVQLRHMAKFMKRFKIVLSLNYDLLVYWATQRENERQPNRFKDCFIHGEFDSDWRRYCEPYGHANRATLVFYPHGNLALATDLNGIEIKLKATTDSSLLKTVTMEWQSGKYSPIFVSEGTSKQKVSAINRSPYLKTIFDSVLPKLGRQIAIFGWSMSNNDKHILRAICRGNLAAVAVSMVTSEPKLQDKCSEIRKKIQHCTNARVIFFDAKSSGCWLD